VCWIFQTSIYPRHFFSFFLSMPFLSLFPSPPWTVPVRFLPLVLPPFLWGKTGIFPLKCSIFSPGMFPFIFPFNPWSDPFPFPVPLYSDSLGSLKVFPSAIPPCSPVLQPKQLLVIPSRSLTPTPPPFLEFFPPFPSLFFFFLSLPCSVSKAVYPRHFPILFSFC